MVRVESSGFPAARDGDGSPLKLSSSSRRSSSGTTKQSVISNCVLIQKVVSWNHETTTADIRCCFRAELAARDPAFGGVSLRSPVAWRVAGGARHDLPGCGAPAR